MSKIDYKERVPNFYVFEQGKLGFKENRDCPFPVGSTREKEWTRGWNFAYFENIAESL